MPTTWQSAKWWRNRPPEHREYFIKAPKRYVEDPHTATFPFEEGGNYFIVGKSGTGKTTLAVKTAMEAVRRHQLSARFVSADEYVEMIKDTFDNSGDLPEMWSSPHLVKYIKGVFDIVILDGVGQERLTEFARHELGSLIRRRFEMGLSTIITSDIPSTDIITKYGQRVAGPLNEYTEIYHGR
jgi:DNA replication protein DnaC